MFCDNQIAPKLIYPRSFDSMTLVLPRFSSKSFLRDVRAYDVDANGEVRLGEVESPLDSIAIGSVRSGVPETHCSVALTSDDSAAVMSIPIYRGGRIVSLVVIVAKTSEDFVGVFETWTPVGIYEELNLSGGYFAGLERFQNVSSFIRFEKGLGLPGQVWQDQKGIIHNNLSTHPGFLRAAGASAESLQMAIGIPVAADELIGVAVLIGAAATPIARGFEVWTAGTDGFSLDQASYCGLSPELQLEIGTKLSTNGGLPGLAAEHGGASTTENKAFLYAGRSQSSPDLTGALAIPFYQDEILTSVTALLF